MPSPTLAKRANCTAVYSDPTHALPYVVDASMIAGVYATQIFVRALIGEPGWDRTIDLLIKSQLLYR